MERKLIKIYLENYYKYFSYGITTASEQSIGYTIVFIPAVQIYRNWGVPNG